MIEFQQVIGVVPDVETQAFSFTNLTGGLLTINGIGGEGTAAEWLVYIEGVLKVKRLQTASIINFDVDLHRFKLEDTKNIIVNVKHCQKTNADFSVEMRYES